MATPVEQIKSRLDIVDVIGGYIRLNKAGSAYKALCPFHQEKTPSFTVSSTRQSYHCFGCNRGGDTFTFIEEIEGLDFPGALRLLADRAGVVLTREDRGSAEERSEKERLIELMHAAEDFFVSKLRPEHGAYAYLTERGLTPETMKRFRIGFALHEPDGWRALSEHLRSLGYKDEEIEKAGLSKKLEKETRGGSRHYDRFRGRIMFPIWDQSGRTIAFSGRIFPSDGGGKEGVAKYVNSPETVLYDKSAVLFGLDKAKTAIRRQNFAIIVEGQMDLILAHQAGSDNSVAVSGTALSEKHMLALKRLTGNLVFAFDADAAGLSAAGRAYHLALQNEMSVRVAKLPQGKDPADMIRENPKAWEQAIMSSRHLIEVLLDVLSESTPDPLLFRKKTEEIILPYVAAIRSSIEQAHFVLEIARRLGIPDQAIWEDLGKIKLSESRGSSIRGGTTTGEAPSSRVEIPASIRVKEELIGLYILSQEKDPSPADLSIVAKEIERISGAVFDIAALSDSSRNTMAFRAEQTYDMEQVSDKLFRDLLSRYELLILEGKQADLQREIVRAERAGENEKAKTYLEQFGSISQQVNQLKKILST